MFVEIREKCVLVVTSSDGIQVWSVSGDEMLFQFELSSVFGTPDEVEDLFARGIAVLSDLLCVGSSSGQLLVFDGKDGAFDLSLIRRVDTGKSPICAISSFKDILASGNDCGDIYGFSLEQSFANVFTFFGAGSPCTTICQSDEWLFAGFSTGHIRVYRTDIMEMTFEISAHTRAVTGLTINNTRSFIASCGKDQIVHVWRIPDYASGTSCSVDLLSSEILENKLCTGLAFMTDDRLCVASYDDDELVTLRK